MDKFKDIIDGTLIRKLFLLLKFNNTSRSSSRYRGIILGGLSTVGAKAINLVMIFVSVPLTLEYLGSERFGMWMTVSSLTTLLSFADLGVGNGLVSSLASADGRDDRKEMHSLVTSAFFLLLGIGILILICFSALYPYVNWSEVFSVVGEDAQSEIDLTVLLFIFCFCIALPLGIVQRVQMALQETWLFSLWQAGGYFVSLVLVVYASYVEAEVPWLVLAMSGPPIMVSLLNGAVEFFHRRPYLMPKISSIQIPKIKLLLGIGGIFFALQLLNILGVTVDSLIISHVKGAAAVTPYAILMRVFQVAMVFTLFLQPLWPALTEAVERGDFWWAKKALKRAFMLTMGLGLTSALVLVFWGRAILTFWVGEDAVPKDEMIYAFAAYILSASLGGVVVTFLNNNRYLRIQLYIYAIASLIVFAVKIPAIHAFGVSGMMWATTLGYTLFFYIPAGIFVYRVLQSPPSLSAKRIPTRAFSDHSRSYPAAAK